MINYYLLTKPGIIFGNLITMIAGFMLASKGHLPLQLFFMTLLGLAMIMASGCIFNNYIDRYIDGRMERTKNRPFVNGTISATKAFVFAIVLLILGSIFLFFYVNTLSMLIANMGFIVYVFIYSFLKSRTTYATAIGSIAGAIPPVVGYCAVRNQIDIGAMILFAMLVLWQMPHFFSIAVYRLTDYARANIPILPVKKGMLRTKIHIILYIIAFIAVSSLLTYFKYTGWVYLSLTVGLSLLWLGLALKGFNHDNDEVWGKQMFKLSLVLIIAMSGVIPFDVVA